MADNLLDTTQNDLGATISQDPSLPSPQEQEARLARIREQEQALAERRRKSEETVNTLVNNIRGRINEEQRGGNALYEQFFAESARQQEANRARVTRNDSQPVFNPVTRTFSAGQTPDRSDEQAAVTAELKTQMGISSLGAALPTVEASYKEGVRRTRAMAQEQDRVRIIESALNFADKVARGGSATVSWELQDSLVDLGVSSKDASSLATAGGVIDSITESRGPKLSELYGGRYSDELEKLRPIDAFARAVGQYDEDVFVFPSDGGLGTRTPINNLEGTSIGKVFDNPDATRGDLVRAITSEADRLLAAYSSLDGTEDDIKSAMGDKDYSLFRMLFNGGDSLEDRGGLTFKGSAFYKLLEKDSKEVADGVQQALDLRAEFVGRIKSALEKADETSLFVMAEKTGIPQAGELPFLTESMRRDIAKTPGGAYAVREYDNRLSSVIDTLNSAIPDVLDEQGMVKGDELLAKARSSERYTPALAGAVKKYAEQMTKAYNTSELESQKLKQTVTNMKLDESIKRANLDAAEQDALQGGGYGAALKAINDGKESVYAPELSALSKAGMPVADQVIYLAGKLETPDSRSARYKAITNVTAKDVIGPDVNLNAEAVAEFEVNNTILEQARQNAADYYQQAVRRGENPVQYMTRQMADDIPEGTDDAEALYYIRQMTEMADQYVNNDVNTRAQAIIDQQTAGAKNAIVLMGSRLTSQGIQGRPEAYDFSLDTWKAAKGIDAQRLALNGMFTSKLEARLNEIIGAAADPSSLGAIMDTYGNYIDALGAGGDGELANDPVFQELVGLRDAYVEKGLELSGSQELATEKAVLDMGQKLLAGGYTMKDGDGNIVGLTHEVVTIGDGVYALPKSIVYTNENRPNVDLINTIVNNSENPYVQRILSRSAGGIISDADAAELAAMRKPASPIVDEIYGKDIRQRVSTAISQMQIGDHVRIVAESGSLLGASRIKGAPYSEREYNDVVKKIAGAVVDGDEKDLDDLLVNASDKHNLKNFGSWAKDVLPFVDSRRPDSIKDIVDKNPVLNDMFYNGETIESRQRAVVMAYIMQRDQVQHEAVVSVAGGSNIKTGKQVKGAKQHVDEGLAKVGVSSVSEAVSILQDRLDYINGESAGILNADISYMARIDDIGSELNIDKIRDRIKAHDESIEVLKNSFSAESAERFNPALVSRTTSPVYGNIKNPASKLDADLSDARMLVEKFDSIKRAYDAKVNRYRSLLVKPGAFDVIDTSLRDQELASISSITRQ